ncbi:MAG: hypothetical protein ATN36_02020 [Epulopiscium sp. Nele67-Bin005]|nr:MAG: hypothetical protein ATN36_02020 [Epulopiscium sp. Nele67-Bin005]
MKKFVALVLSGILVIPAIGCSANDQPIVQEVEQEVEVVVENTEEEVISEAESVVQTYTGNSKIVTTGQYESYDKDGNVITYDEASSYFGQDADYDSLEFSFTNNGDGTISDNNTGLMWQEIPIDSKMTWSQAMEYCESLELGGYTDWRLPTAVELFSISDFSEGWPYIDISYFVMPDSSQQGGAPQGGNSQNGGPQGTSQQRLPNNEMPELEEGMIPPERPEVAQGEDENSPPPMQNGGPQGTNSSQVPQANIPPEGEGSTAVSKDEGQFWSSNYYLVEEEGARNGVAFGVNHATGHIKAYIAESAPAMGKNVRAVRGEEYAVNDFVDNGDGTVTDNGTGLMWMSVDAGVAVDWEEALVLAKNSDYAGYTDWRLPDVKELQSLVDYSGSYPAIDPAYFECSELLDNEFYYYWTNTSAYFSSQDPTNYYAWYVAFGYAVDDGGNDTHGAGGVRFSQKYPESDAKGEGGDNMLNSVRLVRTVD